ncbi:MAG: Holliday junction resolvase RuvX [Deltaproteobacteria bacterium]|nr:Holliday junction resolvase RuvX [Deltaproteobacteria bacterium]
MTNSPRGRVLGIDLGLQRTGLALSDELGLSTRGLPNLTPRSRAQDVAFLIELCRSEAVVDVVVGLPLMPSGDESPMSKRARGFAAALETAIAAEALAVSVHLIDERGSSKAAAARLVESEIKKSKRKELLDSEAARVLVEDLLARRR